MGPERPGGALPESQLFQLKVRDGKPIGFTAPDERYYPLQEGEELVQILNENKSARDTFIRKDGQDIPFETWKQGK